MVLTVCSGKKSRSKRDKKRSKKSKKHRDSSSESDVEEIPSSMWSEKKGINN